MCRGRGISCLYTIAGKITTVSPMADWYSEKEADGDDSMSLQTGKPWMIERNGFIESIEAWCKDTNDRLLGAFVTLRLLSSEVFKLLGPKPTKVPGTPLHGLESLLAIINARIEEWEHRWIHWVDTGMPIDIAHADHSVN
jgi:hypothetical protein